MILRWSCWLALREELRDVVLVAEVLVDFAASIRVYFLELFLNLALCLKETFVVTSCSLRLRENISQSVINTAKLSIQAVQIPVQDILCAKRRS